MAAKRDNTPSRWTLVLASGVAAAGFWFGILNGPQPANATPPQASVQTAATQNQFQGQTGSRFTSPSFPSPQISITAPRFRTRGS